MFPRLRLAGGLDGPRSRPRAFVPEEPATTWPTIGRIKIRKDEQTRSADKILPEDEGTRPMSQRPWEGQVPRPGQRHDIDERIGPVRPRT